MKKICVIIILVFALTACNPIMEASTPTSISAVATKTLVATRTPIQTVTPTPTITITPTFLPTLTPASPENTQTTGYELVAWSPEQADLLINQVYSELIAREDRPEFSGTYGQENFDNQFIHVLIAEQEALLRFKTAPPSLKWRWDLAFNSARAHRRYQDFRRPELAQYAELIETALNSGEILPEQLPDWFAKHENRMTLDITPFNGPTDNFKGYVANIDNNAYWWIIQESTGKFHVYSLMSFLFHLRGSTAELSFQEITGDLYPELVIGFSFSTCCGFFTSYSVFDVSEGKPNQLEFENYSGVWDRLSSDSGSKVLPLDVNEPMPGFVYESTYRDVYVTSCHLQQYDKYYWNGEKFEISDTWFGIEKPGEYDDKELCQYAIDIAKNKGEMEPIVNAIDDIETNFRAYKGEEYDAIRYRLGEYRARKGNSLEAREVFEDLVSSPHKENSRWVKAAKMFLEHYQAVSDYYRVCAASELCDSNTALATIIRSLGPEQYPQLEKSLNSYGVSVLKTGYEDINRDDILEQWLIIRAPGISKPELWIVMEHKDHLDPLFIGETTKSIPSFQWYWQDSTSNFTSVDDHIFSIRSFALSGHPYLTTIRISNGSDLMPFRTQKQLIYKAEDDLWSGMAPLSVQNQLLNLKNAKDFQCSEYSSCDELYYLLGLTNELTGNKDSAVAYYLALWEKFPDSLFTIMARTKLIQVPK